MSPDLRGIPANPRVSVLMAVCNVAPYLKDALDSVLNQSFRDFEIIVLDDGSTDESGEVLRRSDDARVRVFEQENRGIAATRNRMLEFARGEYAAVLDGDDEMLPERLTKQVGFLDTHPEMVIVGGQLVETTEEGEVLSAVHRYSCDSQEVVQRSSKSLIAVIPHGGSMYRVAVARAIGGYDLCHPMIGEDVDFIRRLLQHGNGTNLPEAVIRYRLRRGSACNLYRQEAARLHRAERACHSGRALPITTGSRLPEAEQGARRAESIYYCRIARGALRGGRFDCARAYYRKSILFWPWQWLAYIGFMRACGRVGSGPALSQIDRYARVSGNALEPRRTNRYAAELDRNRRH